MEDCKFHLILRITAHVKFSCKLLADESYVINFLSSNLVMKSVSISALRTKIRTEMNKLRFRKMESSILILY